MKDFNYDMKDMVETVADDVVCKEKILSFIELFANNPNLSIVNLASLYQQNSKAGRVCGIKALEKLGAVADQSKIYDIFFPRTAMKSKPIEFFDGKDLVADKDYPDIQFLAKEAEYISMYLPVKVYDIGRIRNSGGVEFLDKILMITGATIEMVDGEELDCETSHGVYNSELNIFYMEKELPKELMDATIVELYITYVMANYGITDKLVRMGLKSLCFSYFCLEGRISKVLFRGLDSFNHDDKVSYLFTLWRLGTEIVQDIEGYRLSFDETAFINNFMVTDESDELYAVISKIIEGLQDDLLKLELELLREKILKTREGYLNDLLGWKINKVVLTYPPLPLEIDATDYLRDDKRRFLKSIIEREVNKDE